MGSNKDSTLVGLCFILILYTCTKILRQISYFRAKRAHGCLDPPRYPHRDPIWGLDLFFAQKRAKANGEGQLEASRCSFATYGKTNEFLALGTRTIRTFDIKNIQTVFASNFTDFGLEPLRAAAARPFIHCGITSSDGAFWQHSRALIRPTFARVEICNLESLAKQMDEFINKLPRNGSTIDLQSLLQQLHLHTTTEFLFGESSSFHSAVTLERFNQSYNYVIRGIGQRLRLKSFRFLHRDKEWLKAIRIVHEYVDFYVERAIDSQRSQNTKEKVEKPERYILLHEMAKQTQDKLDLRSQIISVFMPSKETVAVLVANIFHVLARRPDIWELLRAEVLSVGSRTLSFEVLKSIKYLQGVLNEGHRLYPIVPFVSRACLKDSILPTGGGSDGKSPIFLRKGDHIQLHTHMLGADKDTWGEDAGEFKPERWKTVKPIWTFLPFGGGPRICPAQQLVNIEAAYIIVRLMQGFSHIENRDAKPWTEVWMLGPRNKYGCQIALKNC